MTSDIFIVVIILNLCRTKSGPTHTMYYSTKQAKSSRRTERKSNEWETTRTDTGTPLPEIRSKRPNCLISKKIPADVVFVVVVVDEMHTNVFAPIANFICVCVCSVFVWVRSAGKNLHNDEKSWLKIVDTRAAAAGVRQKKWKVEAHAMKSNRKKSKQPSIRSKQM